MILKTEQEYYVQNAAEFVLLFKLEEKFKDIFSESIETWQETTFIDDQTIIESLIKFLDGNYFVYFDNSSDGFLIFKILD